MADDEDKDGPGLIDLDMKQWGSGTMQDPLRHAVGMRTAQDKYKMTMWNSWPSIFQNTIFHGEQDAAIKALRQGGGFDERFTMGTKLKEEGNALLKESNLDKAIEKYERGAGLMRYVDCFRPDWKNDDGSYKGIEDEWLRVHDEAIHGDSESASQARGLVTSCYLNIALAAQKKEDWGAMFAAANEVIAKVDDTSAKAYFRRAQARVGPVTAREEEQAAAIEDLAQAAKLAPQDKTIRDLLAKLKTERQQQRQKDRKQLAGMFERGQILNNETKRQHGTAGASPATGAAAQKIDLRDPEVQKRLDMRPVSSVASKNGYPDAAARNDDDENDSDFENWRREQEFKYLKKLPNGNLDLRDAAVQAYLDVRPAADSKFLEGDDEVTTCEPTRGSGDCDGGGAYAESVHSEDEEESPKAANANGQANNGSSSSSKAAAPADVGSRKWADGNFKDEEEKDDGAGLINLDMKQFGTGSMEDPLKHAMAMRTAQDSKKMVMWNSWPTLFQNTIFHGEQDAEVKALRRGGKVPDRIAKAESLKEEGNALLKDGDLEKAIEKYEKGAGILRYVECFRPDWKNEDNSYKGIEDDWLRVDEAALQGDSEDAGRARSLVVSCYLNIALAAQKQEQWEVMERASTEVLEKVDAANAKAFFRRAQAKIAPPTALDSDRDAAIEDLSKAARLEPQNKAIRELLAKLRTEKNQKRAAEKAQYSGLFSRGQVVTNDPRLEGDKPDFSKLDIRDPKVQAMLDIHPGPAAYAEKDYGMTRGT
eukprot:TRINITY_DN10593_c0_g1_i1.p1 TRINITY_DN10593_c0_g1~~TRINITY_DN10593_c0_g1_i1.p1  ORF type:complete len:763 (+),score=247.95 TRINITY_DN10593_c0_g1_i1:76-2364(+)